jgi:hypothetical protein
VRSEAAHYDITADIRHARTLLGDAVATLSGHFELVGPDPLRRDLRGEVLTKDVLLNYKPVSDVRIKFAVRDRQLIVDHLTCGSLSGRGRIGLMGQNDVDLSFDLLSVDVDELLAVLHGQGLRTWPLSGIITGSLILQGPLARPAVVGRVSAYKGQWKDFGYEMIDVRFEGTYPSVRLTEGRVVSFEGPSFSVSGILDLADLGRLEAQIGQLKQELIVADDGAGRTRSLRLNTSDGHATRLKSFVSGDADGRDQGEQIIGLEKHIGF